MARPRTLTETTPFDRECTDLPEDLRWREWMGRLEAVIFAAPAPVSRETLALLVGRDCQLDALLADIADELQARPYELAFVAGGYQLRTRIRFSAAIRATAPAAGDTAGPKLTPTELQALAAIAYMQPATRADISRLAGRDLSRDIIARLKRLDLIEAGLRAPYPGAPFAYVTTGKFLQVFGLGSLRDLPEIEHMQEEGLLVTTGSTEIDAVLEIGGEEGGE
ncbi:MAG: SMC-Scp complex subunit ScpB [Hyphomicrobiales bacterium]|nr:SMC-Scp complex subunit ScpB [Hyphomicrobiales bacterium]